MYIWALKGEFHRMITMIVYEGTSTRFGGGQIEPPLWPKAVTKPPRRWTFSKRIMLALLMFLLLIRAMGCIKVCCVMESTFALYTYACQIDWCASPRHFTHLCLLLSTLSRIYVPRVSTPTEFQRSQTWEEICLWSQYFNSSREVSLCVRTSHAHRSTMYVVPTFV